MGKSPLNKSSFFTVSKLDDVMSHIGHAHYLQGDQGTQQNSTVNAV